MCRDRQRVLGIPYNLDVGSGGSKSRKATRPIFADCKVTTDRPSFHTRNETTTTQELYRIHHDFNNGHTTTSKQLQYAREHRFQHPLAY
jgi:hypothetical protein